VLVKKHSDGEICTFPVNNPVRDIADCRLTLFVQNCIQLLVAKAVIFGII